MVSLLVDECKTICNKIHALNYVDRMVERNQDAVWYNNPLCVVPIITSYRYGPVLASPSDNCVFSRPTDIRNSLTTFVRRKTYISRPVFLTPTIIRQSNSIQYFCDYHSFTATKATAGWVHLYKWGKAKTLSVLVYLNVCTLVYKFEVTNQLWNV